MRVKSLIVWSENMSVGVPEIDNEHKSMIDIIGKLYSCRKDNSRKVLPQSVSSLISHTIEHFTSEEDYMKKIQFSEWSEHCEIHKVFLDRLVSLEKKMGANDLFVLGDNELNEIARWLFNHILTDDKDYAIFAARLANVQLAEC